MPQDFTARVLRNTDLGHDNFLLEFELPHALDSMTPAQFFMLGIPGSAPLLRRPYSVCGLPGTFADGTDGAVQILYKAVGQGSRLLASLGSGAEIRLLGPLGNGFRRPKSPERRALFVAGGIGSAPFPALNAWLSEDDSAGSHMIYGARGQHDLPLLDWFRKHCAEVTVTTDDGSLGLHGRVTEALEPMLGDSSAGPFEIYACGPEPMLKAVAKMALAHDVPCQLSLEAHMACGFGVCLGCVVPVRRADATNGYERVCVEGPVMDAEHMAW